MTLRPNVANEPLAAVIADNIRLRTELDTAIRVLVLANRTLEDLPKAERKGYLEEARDALSAFVDARRSQGGQQ